MIEISEQFREEDQRREAFTRCCLACSRHSDIQLKNSQQHQEYSELSSFEAKILYPTFRESINEKEPLFSNILCLSCEERFNLKQSQVKVLRELLRFYEHPQDEENISQSSPKDNRLQIKELVFLIMHALNEVKGTQYQQQIMENEIRQIKQEQSNYPLKVFDILRSCQSSNRNLQEKEDNSKKNEGTKPKKDIVHSTQQQQIIQKFQKLQTQQFQNKFLLHSSQQQQQQNEVKPGNESLQQSLKTHLPSQKQSTSKLQCSPCNLRATSQNADIIQDQVEIQQLEGSSLLEDQINEKIKQYTIRPKSSIDKKQPTENDGKDTHKQREQQTGGSSKIRRRRQSLEDTNKHNSKAMSKYIENRRYSVARQSTQQAEEIIHQRENNNNIISGQIAVNQMKDKVENYLDTGLISRIRTESPKNAYSMYLDNSLLKVKSSQEKRAAVLSKETPTGQDAKKKKKVVVKLTKMSQVEQRTCISSNNFSRKESIDGVGFGEAMNHGKLQKEGQKNTQDQLIFESQINKHKERSNSTNTIQDSTQQSKKAQDFRDQSLRKKRLQDNLKLLMNENNNKGIKDINTNNKQSIQDNGCSSNLTQDDESIQVQYLETADIPLIRDDSQVSLGDQQSSREERPASKLNESEFLSRERYLSHHHHQQPLGLAKYPKDIRSRTLESSQDEDIYHINRSNNSVFSTTQDRCYTTGSNSSSKQLAQQIRGRVISSSLNCSLMRSLRASTSPTEKEQAEISKKPGMVKPTPQQEISIIKNAIQQGDLINGCFVQNNARLSEGAYLVSAQWWRQWRQYVGLSSQPYTNKAAPARNSTASTIADNHPSFSSLRPSTILNKELLAQPLTDKPYKLKEHLLQHYHYEAIPKRFFQYLSDWYGVDYEIVRYYKVDPSQAASSSQSSSASLFLDIYPEKQSAYSLPTGSRKKNSKQSESDQTEGSTNSKKGNNARSRSSCSNNNSSNKTKNKEEQIILTTQDTPEQKIKSKQQQQKAFHASIDLSHIDCLIQASSPHNEQCVFGSKTSTAENKSSLCTIF